MDTNEVGEYYEKCNQLTMPTYLFFLEKLRQIEKIVKYNVSDSTNLLNSNICPKCNPNFFYKLGNIVWSDDIKHKIETHQNYPSEYFIKIIINMCIINGYIINPPIQISPEQTKYFTYIPLHYNKLLIIDALMRQGSWPRYLYSKNGINKYIYSEHSGVITIKNKRVDNIIISETDRINVMDDNIYLPSNTNILNNYEYLFHTHPNTQNYGGRIKDGIIYELPSANDLLNFIKYHDSGRAQASIIIAPEGVYVVRPIWYIKKYQIIKNFYTRVQKFILKLERFAIKKLEKFFPKITDPDIFHNKIGSNFSFVKLYNKFIEPYNLFIEYYPREKRNNEWCLRPINLPYLEM